MRSTVDELELRTGNEISHGTRDEYLAGLREGQEARGDMDADSGQPVTSALDLARVEPARISETQAPKLVAQRECAIDGSRGAVEAGEHAVSGEIGDDAAERLDSALAKRLVRFQQLAPAGVSELDGPHRRIHDIGEEDRAERPAARRARTASGQELLNFIDHAIDVSDGKAVVLAWNFDEPGSGYPAGDVASSLGGDDRIPAVDHQGRRADRRQDVTNVELKSILVTAAATPGLATRRKKRAYASRAFWSSAMLGFTAPYIWFVPQPVSIRRISASRSAAVIPHG